MTLMRGQCVFVTRRFNKPIIGLYQFLDMPEAAGETHVTIQRLLSLLWFMRIV